MTHSDSSRQGARALPEPYWYTAEGTVQAVSRGLEESEGEAIRWLKEGAKFLLDAQRAGDLERCIEPPTTSIDARWDTLIAAVLRHRLRGLGVDPLPRWTYKEPLAELWFPGAATPTRAASAIALAPLDLRRVGIMLPETALQY